MYDNIREQNVDVTDLENSGFKKTCKVLTILMLQPGKYQLSNSLVSDISKSVVKDKKLIVHNSYPGAI